MFKITKDTLYNFYVPAAEVAKLTEEQWGKFRRYLVERGAVCNSVYGLYKDRIYYHVAYISGTSTQHLTWADCVPKDRTAITAQDILHMIGDGSPTAMPTCECYIMKAVSRRKELKKLIDDSYAEMYAIDQMLKKHGVQVIEE